MEIGAIVIGVGTMEGGTVETGGDTGLASEHNLSCKFIFASQTSIDAHKHTT